MENKIAINTLSGPLSGITGKSKKQCEDFLREFFKLAAESLEGGESLRVKGFGTFKVVNVESRSGINVSTGAKQEIPSYKKVTFTPSKELAAAINAPFADFDSEEMEDEMPDDIIYPEMEDVEISEEEEEAGNGFSDDEISDEDRVSEGRLEEGSAEEGDDDLITYEAYKEIEEENAKKSENHTEIEEEMEPEIKEKMIAAQNEAEEVPETRVPLPVYEEEPKSRFGTGFLIGSLSTFAVCAVIFMLGCFFDWWPVNFGNPKSEVVTEVPVLATEKAEETAKEEGGEENITPIYDTVTTTRYLTTIAREHYGNYNFWPYIYIENESILGHPDRITPGTQVIVPELSKYGVDPNNKDDVAAAKQKGLEIYARFK